MRPHVVLPDLRWTLVAAAIFVVLSGAIALVPLRTSIPVVHAATNCDVDAAGLSLDVEEQTAFTAINSNRAAQNLMPLSLSTVLTRIALWKSTDMALHGYAGHDDLLLQRSFDQRMADCGYVVPGMAVSYAENIAGCDPGGVPTVAQWMASSEHRHNLLGPDYKVSSVKRARGADGCWYWTMLFGSVGDNLLAGAAGAAGAAAAAKPFNPITTKWPCLAAADMKAVQKLIDAGKNEEALAKLVEILKSQGVDFSIMDGPKYDSGLDGEGTTDRAKGGKVKIGKGAFTSAAWLYSSLMHEYVHSQQWQDPDAARKQGSNGREQEAYGKEIENRGCTGISNKEQKELESRLGTYRK